MKRVILCADDFGQNQEVCRGILSLIEKRKLSATSCLVGFPSFVRYAESLYTYKDLVDVGLHLNLTMERLGDCYVLYRSIKGWLVRTHLGYMNTRPLKDEIRTQLDLFLEAMHGKIDFIDGHEHVHHLPWVRKALLEVYQEYFPDKNVYIRSSLQDKSYTLGFSSRFKSFVIGATGGKRMVKLLAKEGIPYNKSFGGIYSYHRGCIDLEYILRSVPEGALVMCHPALEGDDGEDPLYGIRSQEYDFLLNQYGVRPVRFGDLASL